MKKPQVHKSDPNAELKIPLIMTSDKDIQCDIRINFVNHWVVKGIHPKFIVENSNSWDPHSVIITNPETVQKSYTVLAEGERGP